MQVVKFFENDLRLDWPPDFRTDMQTTVLADCIYLRSARVALHRQIDPRDLRNLFWFYSTAKTIDNMFNLVTETLKRVVKYLNIKGVERETKAL